MTKNHTEVTALVTTNVWLNTKDDFEVIEIYFRLFIRWTMAKSLRSQVPCE